MEADAEILPARDNAPCLDCECTHDKGYCSCKHTVTSRTQLQEKSRHYYRVQPVVGMGVTLPCGSDRYPGTISWVGKVKGKPAIGVVNCDYKRVDNNGMSECQSYVFFQSQKLEDKVGTVYTLRKNGRWVRDGEDLNRGSCAVLGHRDAHYDFSF